MQTKIFFSQSPTALETSLNKWLSETKPRVSRVLQTQSETPRCNEYNDEIKGIPNLTVTVFYLEEHEK